ncbi:hypothetical protein [Pseudomonas sp.]|uniref:hypothetical protein n=1 Tax=Pseudomonas sp. TaxID=306 RepID=UPI0037C579AC
MLGLAEGRPLSSQKTIGKSDRLLGERYEKDTTQILCQHLENVVKARAVLP